MKFRRIAFISLIVILLVESGIFLNLTVLSSAAKKQAAQGSDMKKVTSIISADGAVTAQDQATLHFQTGGKLIALPLKQGDKVYAGQTIAQLDTYALQRQLSQALNTYRSTRDSFDQTKDNQNNNLLQNQQRTTIKAAGGASTDVDSYVNDVAKRIVDENQANLDNSVLTVEITNYALQLATLTSPISGVVTHEDVTVAGQNVTTSTSFVVADPTSVVFRANIAENDIDYVSVGAAVTIALDGSSKRLQGTVTKIYPAKVTLSNGQAAYQVDIESDNLKNAKLDQSGTVLITGNTNANITLVPMWTVLAGKYVWVDHNGQTMLKEVKTGRVHGSQIEIESGLSDGDKVITDPQSLSKKKYLML